MHLADILIQSDLTVVQGWWSVSCLAKGLLFTTFCVEWQEIEISLYQHGGESSPKKKKKKKPNI